MDDVPHTPQAEFVIVKRIASGAKTTLLANSTSRTLYVFSPCAFVPAQYRATAISSTVRIWPSECKKPWASSISLPGVRMVVRSEERRVGRVGGGRGWR